MTIPCSSAYTKEGLLHQDHQHGYLYSSFLTGGLQIYTYSSTAQMSVCYGQKSFMKVGILACFIVHFGKCPCVGNLSALTLSYMKSSTYTMYFTRLFTLAYPGFYVEGCLIVCAQRAREKFCSHTHFY